MKFRIARHTDNLQKMTDFYCDILGLKVLGSFKDHDHYDGIFIGIPDCDWHLEFTVSDKAPKHQPDDDDLLVFYMDDEGYDALKEKFRKRNIEPVVAVNPYWTRHGTTYVDPDGFRIVITKTNL